jgi:hypothetical protein
MNDKSEFNPGSVGVEIGYPLKDGIYLMSEEKKKLFTELDELTDRMAKAGLPVGMIFIDTNLANPLPENIPLDNNKHPSLVYSKIKAPKQFLVDFKEEGGKDFLKAVMAAAFSSHCQNCDIQISDDPVKEINFDLE